MSKQLDFTMKVVQLEIKKWTNNVYFAYLALAVAVFYLVVMVAAGNTDAIIAAALFVFTQLALLNVTKYVVLLWTKNLDTVKALGALAANLPKEKSDADHS